MILPRGAGRFERGRGRGGSAEPSPLQCILGASGFLLATAALLYAVVAVAH